MAEFSLHDAIRGNGYEASLIATYNAHFPFYEEVVLNHLRAAGCRHNIVLADARQCAISLSDTFTAPRRAGAEYTLVPVRSAGAFHPKILLLAGRSKGAVCVGSHNLTISGFGFNRELTNLIEANSTKNSGNLGFVRAVWTALKGWLAAEKDYLPRATVDAVLSLKNHAPWIDGDSLDTSDHIFLWQGRRTASLLEQLDRYAPKTVARIIVVGAFFDSKMQFLRALQMRWPKAKMVAGIEPDTVSLPGKAIAMREFDFRDASELARGSGYLHAKAIFLEGKGGDHLLVSGSANPSALAWLMGNEEAVALIQGSKALAAARELGLLSIPKLLAIRKEQWSSISTELPEQEAVADAHSIVVACTSALGFELSRKAFHTHPKRCWAHTDAGTEVELHIPKKAESDTLVIAADIELSKQTRRLKFELRDGSKVEAIVHQSNEIANLGRSSNQVLFRAALQGLGDGSADIAKLVALVEKVIFDDTEMVSVEIPSAKARGGKDRSKEPNGGREKPESLAINIAETKPAKQLRRLLKGGDLGYLLDVLIHHLGVGLTSRDSVIVNEDQELNDQSQVQESQTRAITINDAEIAELCRRKVRKLVKRMTQQLDHCVEDTAKTPVLLVQLVAVLAVLRELRILEKQDRWRRAKDGLVDADIKRSLLDHVLASFFGKGRDLFAALVGQLGSDRFDEIARLKGLMLWLTWDCSITLDRRFGFAEQREDVDDRVWCKAALLELTQMLSGDDIAHAEVRSSILSVVQPNRHQAASRWLDDFDSWANEIADAVAVARGRRPVASRSLRIGDIAFIDSDRESRLRVVRSISDESVSLFDFCERIEFRRDRVSSAECK